MVFRNFNVLDFNKIYNKTSSRLYPNNYSTLIKAAKSIAANALTVAAETDAVHLFAEKTLDEIKEAKILTASISSNFGGKDLGLKPGSNFALLQLLKIIGSGNLVMGRVLEGHINAQLLIAQFGSEEQKRQFADDAFAGKLFGVWNTQANDGTFLTENGNGDYFLNGAKTFATGTHYVSRPVITAAFPNGSWQMMVVPLDKISPEIDQSWWDPMGMKASRSYKMSFDQAKIPTENLLGKAGNYYEQPGFSGGSVRFAAVQLGAAERLFQETRIYLQTLNRIEDPYQKMRLGKMAIAIESGNQWILGAAKQLDQYMTEKTSGNSDQFLAYANMMRTAIEEICTEMMALCQKCVGARGLNKPYHFERIIRDLNTYLRQPAPDESLAEVGRYVLQSEMKAGELWKISNKMKEVK